MNIESLLNKIKLFQELVIKSGFKRDIVDFKQAIAQSQNRNIVFMKELTDKLIANLIDFENNSLNSELKLVLKESEPFTSLNILEELRELNNDKEIAAAQYFQKLNTIFSKLQQAITANETEQTALKLTFDKYVSDNVEYGNDEEQALMSLIFKDLKSTGSLKEFSRVLNRWNRTIMIYHTLLKSEPPKDISLVEIQNGSIDVIFNIDVDIAIDLTELIKTGVKVYGAYLLYKSKNAAREIIDSYMGNKKLISMEKEREVLMLDNIKESVKKLAMEQHKIRLKKDKKIEKTGIFGTVAKKIDVVAEVITDHIIKGNEVKLLALPIYDTDDVEEDEERDLSKELREETAVVRERYKKLSKPERQLLLDRYTIKEEDKE